MLNLLVDADACPVKQEIYRVARRYELNVTLVTNSWMRTPAESWISLKVVGDGLDEADDWIVDHVRADDIVITADIPLANRCLQADAHVLSPTGKPFTDDNIGQAVATRNLLTDLRSAGQKTAGPPPLNKSDRSRFLQHLDQIIQSVLGKESDK